MKNLILNTYSTLVDITMVLIIAISTILGATNGGVIGAIIGAIGSFIFVTIFFGVILLFVDMRESLKSIKDSLEK